MSALQTFRHYRISQDPKGGAVEAWRSGTEIVCLAVDTPRQVFVELHVAIAEPARLLDFKQFQQLATQAGQIRHRHVLAVLDSGEDEGASYYVTEFVDGERLDTYLARCNPLPVWLSLQILGQIAEGAQALAAHPRLLAGADIFNSSMQLLGESPADLLVKVCDLGLALVPQQEMLQPGVAQRRVFHDLGCLLFYMLTGNMKEGPLGLAEAGRLAPELAFLLSALTDVAHRHHPASWDQLRGLIDRCRRDLPPEHAALPEKLAPSLRPRLPLQAHFLQPSALADYLSEDYQVDGTAFDATHPYRHQAINRATKAAAVIQVLPPARLIPNEFARNLRQALQRINSLDHPHLLRVMAYWESENPEFFIEEAAGKLTLAQVVRMKGGLNHLEAAIILEHLLEAGREAEACGLVPVIRAPAQIFFHFLATSGEPKTPTETSLAALPLEEWPAFRVRIRAHVTTLNVAQPERFNAERLLPAMHAGAESGPASRHSAMPSPPTVRDFALLASFMTQGTDTPEKARHLIFDHLGNRKSAAQGEPREFVENLAMVPGRASAKTPAAGKSGSTGRKKKQAPVRELASPPEENVGTDLPSSAPAPSPPTALLGSAAMPLPERSPGQPAPGFAEVLFGAKLSPDEEDEPPAHPFGLFGTLPEDVDPLPNQPNFLDGLPQQEPLDPDFGDFDDSHRGKGRTFLLVLLVILIAAVVAGILAHFTGMAFWLRN
ncbi:MAG: protein kinase [Verrucomicrobiales bacterium]|nr:protein kinase [Verrucomicrobiales bacterium]